MNKLLVALLLIPAFCFGEGRYEGYTVNLDSVTTGSTASTKSVYPVSGKVIAINALLSSTNASPTATVWFVTSAGSGASVSGSKTLFNGPITSTLSTNVASVTYLSGDTITLGASNGLHPNISVRAQIIMER